MRQERALLAKAYDAFNARDAAALGAVLHDEAQWPDSLEGGQVQGRQAVIDYFARQFDLMQLDARLVTVREEPPARIVLEIQYAVRSREGQLWSDTRAVLAYDFADGLIRRMTVLEGL
ncbi:nuclear transport factor 2 family protein [Caulobacter henricii]|uniref:SnoaL-like domain-containing protein n=1 Tax=Caulobacter henricii TaxID=69395 RepID=A0A0P0NYZ2_9CAUL|nr:nuclear transport factor 2 family protein [Caulobacter henricii]ALL13063.1 hypothetical protein AQ619_06700 [Caulobacter henricii]